MEQVLAVAVLPWCLIRRLLFSTGKAGEFLREHSRPSLGTRSESLRVTWSWTCLMFPGAYSCVPIKCPIQIRDAILEPLDP